MAYLEISSRAAALVAILIGLSWPQSAGAGDDAAAHAMAQKFAGASEEAKRNAAGRKAKEMAAREEAERRAAALAAEKLKADEAEMLERARGSRWSRHGA